jgi:hypothetical protein
LIIKNKFLVEENSFMNEKSESQAKKYASLIENNQHESNKFAIKNNSLIM